MNAHHSPIDLHCHSTFSDGTLPPEQVVAQAAARGITVLALTDHDTVAGLPAAAAAAQSAGIVLVPGVEISVTWNGASVHIVGLGIDPASPELSSGLAHIHEQRAERAREIARKLVKAGVTDADAWLTEQAPHNCTRMHFARFLTETGRAHSPGQAFKRFLSRGKSAYVSVVWASLADAVNWIVDAGGAAVVAHPGRYNFSAGRLRQLLEEFAALGGQAMEVNYGGCDRGQINQLCALAKRFKLAGSLGSDFHDPALPWTRFGQLLTLPDTIQPVWQQGPLARFVTQHASL